MRALYVSHNGMLDPLGQSQVLPYLRGLARRGIEFDLVSFELPERETDAIEALRDQLRAEGVRWWPLRRARDPRLQTKVKEAARGVLLAVAAAGRRRPTIVHGRGYIPTAVGDAVASAIPGAKLLFDCRGMLGDEYVDAGHWTEDRIEYRLLKRYESRAFKRAEGVVVLTHALRRWLLERGWIGQKTHIETIPCCVDFGRFHFDGEARRRVRAGLGLSDEHLLVVYSGSLSALYREADLARFVGVMKRRARQPFAFLALTQSPHDNLVRMLRESGIEEREIVVRKALPTEMAAYLSAGDAATAFGKSCFARMGCSPTKLAEYFACGLPAAVNDFGDQAEIAKDRETCVMVESFEDDAIAAAADRLIALARSPIEERVRIGRRVAEARFSLERIGIPKYEELYRAMAEP